MSDRVENQRQLRAERLVSFVFTIVAGFKRRTVESKKIKKRIVARELKKDIAGEKNGEPSVELVEEVTFGYQPEDTTMLYPEGVEEGCGFTLLEVRAELDKNCSDQARRFQNIRIIIQTGGTGSVESATSVTVDEQTSQSAGTGVENTIAAHAEVESLAYASHPFRDFSALDAAATLLAQVTAVTDD